MLFSGLPFLYYFLPAVLVCYFAAPRKLKNAVLFVFSLIFYGWGEPRYIVLMIVSIVSGFVFALMIEKKQNKKSKKEVLDINYLDLIPVRTEERQWFTDRRDRIVLKVENTGLFNKIAQKVFNKPQFTKVHLDQQGTFIWPLIDGERTVADIAALVKDEFGEAAEPLYPRIVKYFQIVESYHFIKFANKPSK